MKIFVITLLCALSAPAQFLCNNVANPEWARGKGYVQIAQLNHRAPMLYLASRPQSATPGGGSSTLNDGLTAYWKLDEASGNRADSGANGQELTDNNTVGSAAGKISNAGDFEVGGIEYLSRSDSATLSLGSDTAFTLCAWVNMESQNGTGGIATKAGAYDGNSDEYSLDWNSGTSKFRLFVGNGSSFAQVNSTVIPSTATWYFVVGWHDPTANKIFIQVDNGTPDETAWSGGTQDGSAAFQIGGAAAGFGNLFDGLIDEVGFWKRVLTADERTELYNAGSGKTCCPF